MERSKRGRKIDHKRCEKVIRDEKVAFGEEKGKKIRA